MTTATLDLWPDDPLNVVLKAVFRSGEFGDPRAELSLEITLRW